MFPHCIINIMNFGGGGLLLNLRVFSFFLQVLSAMFLILRKTGQDMIKNVHRSSHNVLFIIVQF